jgi:hypothetical protein
MARVCRAGTASRLRIRLKPNRLKPASSEQNLTSQDNKAVTQFLSSHICGGCKASAVLTNVSVPGPHHACKQHVDRAWLSTADGIPVTAWRCNHVHHLAELAEVCSMFVVLLAMLGFSGHVTYHLHHGPCNHSQRMKCWVSWHCWLQNVVCISFETHDFRCAPTRTCSAVGAQRRWGVVQHSHFHWASQCWGHSWHGADLGRNGKT